MITTLVAACSQSGKEEMKPSGGIKVITAPVRPVTLGNSLDYSGTVEAAQVIPLSFRTVGTIEKIYVDVGDMVTKGQVLAMLDKSELQNIYDAALSKYRQAEDAYNRLKQVYEQGSLPEIRWVEMQTDLEQARSTLELSKNNLEKCSLISPVNGIVGRRNIEPGMSSISLTSASIELVRIETVLVKISVPENEINRLKEGLKANIKVAALEGRTFEGEITKISPVAEIMSRTYTVKISVTNPGRELKPGMVCDVSLNPGSAGKILVVPKKAVTKDSFGNIYVFLVSPDKKTVKKQYITIGRYTSSGIEVLEGLTEGQVIVTEGGEKLSDNSKISL